MILHGIIRTKNNAKMRVTVAGYEDSTQLDQARNVIKDGYPYARTILFDVPKPEVQLEEQPV